MPGASHPTYLSRSAERALVDALDLASAGILGAAGPVDRDSARAVLSVMWSLDVTR